MKPGTLLIALVAVWFTGCEKDDLCNCLESTGSPTTETRLLPGFTSLEMLNNIDVVLVPDTVNLVKITCGKNLVDGIKTTVTDGKLTLKNINSCNWLRDFKNTFVAEVHFRELNQVAYRGSGNAVCADTLRTHTFQVDSWNGTGELNFLISATEVYYKLHTGPADIVSQGKAGILYLYTAGNGYMKMASLESDYVYVTTKSTGDCEVLARKELEATIEYHGDVYYKGNPPVISTHITGSGELIPF